MSTIVLLVGPPGAGKTKYALDRISKGYVRISQDEQGKQGHIDLFNQAVISQENIVIDRMNLTKAQRTRYIETVELAWADLYEIEIVVFHESFDTCLQRCIARQNHPTIKDEATARKALHGFFSKYERVEKGEADRIIRLWPEGNKPRAIVCDLDGTLCNIENRVKFMQQPKKDFKSFFEGIPDDTINDWCHEILWSFGGASEDPPAIVLCSGRPDDYRSITEEWLKKNEVYYTNLFMRERGDYRPDYQIKEIILDFEILSRYQPMFFIDDRNQVVKMYRNRGFTVLQCQEGNY